MERLSRADVVWLLDRIEEIDSIVNGHMCLRPDEVERLHMELDLAVTNYRKKLESILDTYQE